MISNHIAAQTAARAAQISARIDDALKPEAGENFDGWQLDQSELELVLGVMDHGAAIIAAHGQHPNKRFERARGKLSMQLHNLKIKNRSEANAAR